MTLDLKVKWKISRNESVSKDNFFVKLEDNGLVGLGEIAPNVRYGETPEKIKQEFEFLPEFKTPEEILSFLEDCELLHALKCSLDTAAVDLISKRDNKKIWEVLDVAAPIEVGTSISVPIMEEQLLEKYLEGVKRFPYVKIKVNEENAISFTKKIASLIHRPLRIDANEGFSSVESFLAFVDSVKELNIQFMEQPFPADKKEFYMAVKGKCSFEVMADESIEDDADFEELSKQFDSINIKLMKTGGYHRAIELIKKARIYGMKVMLGCMVESSLGISAALRLSSLADYFDLDGSLLISNDPFEFLKEKEGQLALSND